MITPGTRPLRVGELRPSQLLHTYGVGAVLDLPNLSVTVLGLDFWERARATEVVEDRLLAAVRDKLGDQVEQLRTPPYIPETSDVFDEWARVGVPVTLFPQWLRCSRVQCNRLAPATSGVFELIQNPYQPDKIRYVHGCKGQGGSRPVAVPARFVLACSQGHLDDFPWAFYVHRGLVPPAEEAHTYRLRERGTTGEAANVYVECSCGVAARAMSEAYGEKAEQNLPGCRGRHPHLGQAPGCGEPTRTLALGATNTWFAMQLRVFSLPRADTGLDQLVTEYWGQLGLLARLEPDMARQLMKTQSSWPELEQYGADAVWKAIKKHATAEEEGAGAEDALDLLGPEWTAFTAATDTDLRDFTTRRVSVPGETREWLAGVTLVPRLREVAALYGFTRIDAPEWDVVNTPDSRVAPMTLAQPTWVPCAETRGEGIFLRFSEDRLREWEGQPEVRERAAFLIPAHEKWRGQRSLPPGHFPGVRYVLLHTFAHVLIREFALECGYGASGIGERVYADANRAMAGVLLYTAAPDSEGTLGGLVSLGHPDRLGILIDQALDRARLCSSDPLCAGHDPLVHGRLYGAACHACLFASETSCERGNHYLDRALLVDTILGGGAGFFGR
ncbi:DrmB family protein [Sphaerisporangium rhizosphaerae]|uniref:DrmB family protein n=1 Tax=Sphaerisporangium rhizosphaerae TaxID=2269375 RepID=A0ABW2PD05_9ACTN